MIPRLRFDPLFNLLRTKDPAILYFAQRDLLDQHISPIPDFSFHPEIRRLLRGQNQDGSWGKLGGYPAIHRPILETFKRMRLLVKRFELNRSHPSVASGAEFLFSTQTASGDFRGMLGDQYATYYTGEFASILAKAGYADDPRTNRALIWLLSMRQDDGAWTIPVLTRRIPGKTSGELTGKRAEIVEPDRSKPFSHNWTEMVLRGFAANPNWRGRHEILAAANLLKSRFFQPDSYSSYRNANYWVRFVHWWPNLLTALETLIDLKFSVSDPKIAKALEWFERHQESDGSWRLSYFLGNKINPRIERIERPWVTLRVARIFRRSTADA